MAKQQLIVVAFIIFFVAVGMHVTAEEPNIPAAAANIAPAAAAAGVDTNAVMGALNGAAAGGPIPDGIIKNIPPPAGGSPTGGAAALGTTAAAAGAIAAVGVVGSFFF